MSEWDKTKARDAGRLARAREAIQQQRIHELEAALRDVITYIKRIDEILASPIKLPEAEPINPAWLGYVVRRVFP